MKKLLAFLLTACLLSGVSVAAAETVESDPSVLPDMAAPTEVNAPAPLTLEGRTRINVTTSVSNLEGVEVANFYDSLPATKCKIAFPEADGEKTFSVYTATRAPEALSDFAAIISGEESSVVTVEVYGTNDSLLLDWTQLSFSTTLDGEYAIFSIDGNETKYAFYRFDFTLDTGSYFDLAELCLFKVTTDEPEMMYNIGESIEPGEIPTLIPVPKKETTAETEETKADATETADTTTTAEAATTETATTTTTEAATETPAEPENPTHADHPTFGILFPFPINRYLPRG